MASFYKRGTEQWEVRVRRRGYPPQHATFPSLRDAKAWTHRVEGEMKAGRWEDRSEAEATTLHEALARYAREVTPGKKGAPRELLRIERWQVHPLAHRTLAAIRGRDLADYRREREAQGAASNTIRLELAVISHLFTTARKRWDMEGLMNPAANVEMPRGSRARERRFRPGEEDRLFASLAKCRNPYMHPLARFALETAMRQGEILGLRWSDVDLKRRIAKLGDTKSGDPRTVPLSTRAAKSLRALPRRLRDERVFPLGKWLVVQAWGHAVTRARQRYIAECKAAHRKPDMDFLTDLRFHDLRHEAVSRLFERGLDAMEVASISGHKTMQMLKRYTHLRAERLAEKLG